MRPSAMSDTAMLVPVVRALRHAYPSMRITIFTQEAFRPFFSDIEEIGFVDYIPKEHKGTEKIRRLVSEILELGIDGAADLQDSDVTVTIRKVLARCGVAVSVADKYPAGSKELTRRTRKHLVPLLPVTENYRRAITELGIDFELPARVEKSVRPIPSDVIARAGVKHGKWIGVAPFARHKGKIYPIPLADKLIEILSKDYEHVFILGKGEHEKSFADGMEKRHEGVLSMVGRLDISHEIDIIANLDAIVTVDSVVMHMASIVGTPAVSIWGSTHPYAGFYGYGQEPANNIQLDMPCRPCSIGGEKKCIFGHYHCLTGIPPEMIADAVARITGGGGPEGTFIPEKAENREKKKHKRGIINSRTNG